MQKIKILFLIFSILGVSQVFAQKNDGLEITAGVELRALVPVSFFTMDDIIMRDSANTFTSTCSYQGGYGFGGVIRIKFTKMLNFETGIYYTSRKYKYNIVDPTNDFDESTEVKVIGYELPVKWLIYIRLAEKAYMNVAIGGSADFFATSVESRNPKYTVRAFKESWIKVAALASVGAEYRTEKDGYFYIGGSFHQPFGDIYFSQVDYFPVAPNVPVPSERGLLDGAYFSIDFRYFFAPKKEKKSKVRYVKPDWKNL